MLFRWAKLRPENHRLMEILHQNWDDIRIVDLKFAEFLNTDNQNWTPMIARVGLFTEDMMFVDIPHLTWFCNDQGSIWPVWNEKLPFKGNRWQRMRKRHLRQSSKRGDETPGIGDYYEDIEMIASVRATLERHTKELWIQHKMTSETLLKPPYLNPTKPTMQ